MSDKRITDRDYLFLSAMVKARESKMLTDELRERMLAARSYEDAAKVLVDCGYDDMSHMNSAEVDEALSARRGAIFREIASFSPEKGTAEAFELKYDYHNAKVIIKSRGTGIDAGRLLSGAGRVSAQTLAEAYDNDDYRAVPNILAHAMSDARGILARTNNPQLADFCLDRAYFAELNAIAGGMNGSFMKSYAASLIDGANLRAAVRTVRMGKDRAFMLQAMSPGGSVDAEVLAKAAESGESLASAFNATSLEKAAALGAQAMKGGMMTAFELECDNAVSAYLAGAKMIPFGVEPVAEYLALLESEITAARMILTGRLGGIDPEVIRERLRDINA